MTGINTTNLTPVFATKDGIPFVFVQETQRSTSLFIRHGNIISVFHCVPGSIYTEALPSILSYTSPYAAPNPSSLSPDVEEQLFYGPRGRPVASYLPQSNTIVIKRDGEVFHFSLGWMRILVFQSFDAESNPILLDSMNRLAREALQI